MTEKDLSAEFQKYFCKWFDIDCEVYDKNGTKTRVDLILTLKSDKRFVFGVELKRDGHKQGNHYVNLLNQANGYSKILYNVWCGSTMLRIPILIAPALSSQFIQIDFDTKCVVIEGKEFYAAKHDQLFLHHNMNAICKSYNIGEVRRVYSGWEKDKYKTTYLGYGFIFNNSLLWHEKLGILKDKYNARLKELNPERYNP